MATDQETPGTEAPPAGEPAAPESAPNSSTGGGIKAWLPLIVTIITMPALAYVTTVFVLMPRMRKAVAAATAAATNSTAAAVSTTEAPAAEAKPAPAAAESKGKGNEKGKDKEGGGVNATLKEAGVKITTDGKITVPLTKILVNLSGTMGSRYLLTSLTLAGDKQDFADQILNNQAQLIDLASGILSAKTIADLEKPEARTVIRSELKTVFNNALGSGTVKDVYFTEFAIQ
ncbi:MAG TPA: flagellar basal body-associated FliL family protein [Verrucomicrobiae bacterium]|nr:flagellar basal body-associated FliL family protein [Verrucomicrobiae bacterium]